MSLLPEDAHFEELVQDCFLAFHGTGLMLSPLDAELLAEWADLKVPYEVVARGIRRAAERAIWDRRPEEAVLHTLRSCRKEVGAEIRKYLDRAVGESAPEAPVKVPLELARHKKLRAALKKFARQRPGFEAPVRRLLDGPLAQAPGELTDLQRREDTVIASLTRALPFWERVVLERQVHSRIPDSPTVSANGRRLSRRFHRAALLRQKTELATFW